MVNFRVKVKNDVFWPVFVIGMGLQSLKSGACKSICLPKTRFYHRKMDFPRRSAQRTFEDLYW